MTNIDIRVIYWCISDIVKLSNEASFSKHRCRELSRQAQYVLNTLKLREHETKHLPSLNILYDILRECKEYVIKMSTSNPIQQVFKGYNGKVMYEKLSQELHKWFEQLNHDAEAWKSIENDVDDKEDEETLARMEQHMTRARKILNARPEQLSKNPRTNVQMGKCIRTYALGNIYEGLYNYNTKVIIHEVKSIQPYFKRGVLLNKSLQDCDYILKIHGIADNNKLVYEATMFSLEELIIYNLKNTISLCRKIAAGVNYIHECDIIHKNLCSTTIMIDHQFTPKITGFEMSRKESDETFCITGVQFDMRYWSPERKATGTSSKASDVYAFGIIMCDLGQTPDATVVSPQPHRRPSMSDMLNQLISAETAQF